MIARFTSGGSGGASTVINEAGGTDADKGGWKMIGLFAVGAYAVAKLVM